MGVFDNSQDNGLGDQPRKNFSEEELLELKDSIEKYGVLQPIIVKKSGRHKIDVRFYSSSIYLKIEEKLSSQTRAFYKEVRNLVPAFVEDTPKYKEIEKLIEYLSN